MSLVKCRKTQPYVIRFYKVSKLENTKEHYLRLLHLYIPWRNENELKQDNWSYEDRYKDVEGDILCNVKSHESYMYIHYQELQNFKFCSIKWRRRECRFPMINPNLLDLDLDDSDSLSNATAVSTINNLLPPNEQLYEICSQWMRVNSICSILQFSMQCIVN